MIRLSATGRSLIPAIALSLCCAVSADCLPAPTLLPEKPVVKAAEPQPAPAAIKIGYLDMAKLVADSKLGSSAQAKIKEKQAKFQSQLESKRKQLDKQKSALEAKMATFSPQQREAKAREFQKKVEEFQKFGQNAENELQKLQEQQQRSFFETVEKACAEYGKSSGLTMIIVKKELLYLAGGVDTQDVTEALIKLLDAPPAKK